MKIIFAVQATMKFHDIYDGGTKYIDYLSRYLVKRGLDVTILTTQVHNKQIKEASYQRVNYKFLPPIMFGKERKIKLNMPYKIIFAWNIKKYLEKTDFDIFHTPEMFAYFYLRKKERKPVITQCWGLEPFYGPESLSQKWLKKLYVKLFLQHPWKYCLVNSDKVASEGEFQIPLLERIGVDKKNIFTLFNGMNIQEINDVKKKFQSKRKELGIKKDDLVLLNVNQIAPDKGVDEIIKGFSLIKKEIKNAKLIIIGKGKLEGIMHKLIKSYGLEKDVFHRKNIPEDDLYNYHFSSDIFISSVAGEDFMMSIQEAMVCGLPVVSSAQSMLVKDGVNGYVIVLHNPKGLKDGVLKIYKNKQNKKM